jgi:hypothetical protein
MIKKNVIKINRFFLHFQIIVHFLTNRWVIVFRVTIFCVFEFSIAVSGDLPYLLNAVVPLFVTALLCATFPYVTVIFIALNDDMFEVSLLHIAVLH